MNSGYVQNNDETMGEAELGPLRIYLLGDFQVYVSDRQVTGQEFKRTRVKSLIKLLALASKHRLHCEQILEALWPDLEPAAANNNLRQTLHLARRAIEPGSRRKFHYLHLEDDWIYLCPEVTLWVDVEAFEAIAAAARHKNEIGAYQAALEQYTGELLPQDRYQEWARARRDGLSSLYIQLYLELACLHEEREEYQQAIEAYNRVLACDPAQECAHQGLMRAYALAGQRKQALRQFSQLQAALRQELDVAPDANSHQLYAEIRAGFFPRRNFHLPSARENP